MIEPLKITFASELVVHFGNKVLKTATDIYQRGLTDLTKLDTLINAYYQIQKDGLTKINLEKSDLLLHFNFASKSLNGSFPGPEEVKTYWLRFLIKNIRFGIFAKKSPEDTIIEIAEDLNFIGTYNNYNDFHNEKFILTYPKEINEHLFIKIPYGLNKFQIDVALSIIEQFTTSEVNELQLWYYDYELSVGEMNHTIEIGLCKNKSDAYPTIYRNLFDTTQFLDNQLWYLEIPTFKQYVKNYIPEI